PRWQAVAAIDALGANGIVGELDRAPAGDLFAQRAAAGFQTDLVRLDAAGQLLGYWAIERLPGVDAVAPVSVGALELYGPPTGERLRCEVEVQEVGEVSVRATLQLFTPDGRLHARVVDWQDRCFRLPPRVATFLGAPSTTSLSEPWELPAGSLAADGDLACTRLPIGRDPVAGWVEREVALLVLSRAEREELGAARGTDARKTEWLMGRIAVKDAVRRLLARRHDRGAIWPADVEVSQDARGAPRVRLLGGLADLAPPAVSISHADGVVVALAVDARRGVRPGIDVEPPSPRPRGFDEVAYTPGEQQLLAGVPPDDRDEWVTRLWCAKEAAGKAAGTGLPDGPQAVVAHGFDPASGRVDMTLPDGHHLAVRTARDGDLGVAVALATRSDP
ncbi:MAG: 4'-phosphopantetheinyl transferase family protein, partial [Candidatus Rokuibacteriota bacterium]